MTNVFQAQQEETREKNFVSYSYIYIYTREGFFCMNGKWCVRRGIRCIEKATTTTTLFTKSEIIYLFGYVSLILINFVCLYVLVRCSSNI